MPFTKVARSTGGSTKAERSIGGVATKVARSTGAGTKVARSTGGNSVVVDLPDRDAYMAQESGYLDFILMEDGGKIIVYKGSTWNKVNREL